MAGGAASSTEGGPALQGFGRRQNGRIDIQPTNVGVDKIATEFKGCFAHHDAIIVGNTPIQLNARLALFVDFVGQQDLALGTRDLLTSNGNCSGRGLAVARRSSHYIAKAVNEV